ncbi:DUF2996 domain-containing protein [Nodularia chucula]|uniref:DUF2996 domain-containing protein n=1 Tax=Nodularia chucula TaxID=3093667 RepID=UPI0039C5B64A
MAEEKNQNQAGEVTPSVAAKNAPSADETVAKDTPTANTPDPEAANPEVNSNAATTKTAAPKAAKKEKPPAVEDKPFVEFIEQHYLPSLQTAIAEEGVSDLQLSFAKQKLPISGLQSGEECWQVIGSWRNGERQFNVYFPDESISGQKGFSCNEGTKPSTLESFLIDERRITLDLLVFGLVRRLNSQKWLGRN